MSDGLLLVGVIGLIGIVAAILIFRGQLTRNAVYLIVPVNTLADVTIEFSRVGTFHSGYIRYAVLWLLVALSLPYMRRDWPSILVFTMILYLLPLVLLSSHLPRSARAYQILAVALLMLPLASARVRTVDDLRKLFGSMLVGVYIYVGGWILFQTFKFGSSVYVEEGIHTFLGNGQYAKFLVYALVLVPLMSAVSGERLGTRHGIVLAGAAIIVLLGFHRTSLLALVAGYCVLYAWGTNRLRITGYLAGAAAVGSAALFYFVPRYGELLFELAMRRRLSVSIVEKSARSRETEFVLNTVAEAGPIQVLFGREPFNSRGFIEQATGGQWSRVTHVDFNNLLLGTGVVGLALYLSVFAACVLLIMRGTRPLRHRAFGRSIRASAWALVVAAAFISIGTQLWSITALSTLFLSLGALLGVSRRSSIAAIADGSARSAALVAPARNVRSPSHILVTSKAS